MTLTLNEKERVGAVGRSVGPRGVHARGHRTRDEHDEVSA
jgi:hypothetical protein